MLLTFSGGADFSVNLSLLTTAIAASVILLYTLLGALRGAERAGLRLGLTALSAGLAYLYVLLPGRATFLPSVLRLVERVAPGAIPEELPADLLSLVYSSVWAIAAPVLFLALFLLFHFILFLLYLLLAALIFPSRRYKKEGGRDGKKRARFAGALLGLVTGVLCFLAVSLPYYGYSEAVVANAYLVEEISDGKVTVREANGVDRLAARVCGSEAVLDSLTSFRVDGIQIHVFEELRKAGTVWHSATVLAGEKEMWSREKERALADLTEELEDSPLFSCVLARGAAYLDTVLDDPEFQQQIGIPGVSPTGLRGAHDFLHKLETAEPADFTDAVLLCAQVWGQITSDSLSETDTVSLSLSLSRSELLKSAVVAVANLGEELVSSGKLFPLLGFDTTNAEAEEQLSTALKGLFRALGTEQGVSDFFASVDLMPQMLSFSAPKAEWGEAQHSAVRVLSARLESSAFLREITGTAITCAGRLLADSVGGDGDVYAVQLRSLTADASITVASALCGEAESERRLALRAAEEFGELMVDAGANGYLDDSAERTMVQDPEFVTRIAESVLKNELLHPTLTAAVNATVDSMAPRYNLPADRVEKCHVRTQDVSGLTENQIKREAGLLCAFFTSDPSVTGDPLDTMEALKNSVLFSRFFEEVITYSAEQYLADIKDGKISIHSLPEEIKQSLLAQFSQ